MGSLYGVKWIYRDSEDGIERVAPVCVNFDDFSHLRSSRGVGLRFANKDPKTQIILKHGPSFWILASYSSVKRAWDAYLRGEEPPLVPKPSKRPTLNSLPKPSDN
jgi:hypothetical protein